VRPNDTTQAKESGHSTSDESNRAIPWSYIKRRLLSCGCVVRKGDSEAVYRMRESVLSLSFVEPNKRDRPKKPDEPDPRHALQNGSGHIRFLLATYAGSSCWPEHRLTAVSGGRNIKA
jgi:hypothetical protein